LNQPLPKLIWKHEKQLRQAQHAEEVAMARRAARLAAKRFAVVMKRCEARSRVLMLRSVKWPNCGRARKEQRARELAERDPALRTISCVKSESRLRSCVMRIAALRSEGDTAKLKLARLEGEKQAETARVEAERRAVERRTPKRTLKETLAKYGTRQRDRNRLSLVLAGNDLDQRA
jgi:hypothetical protein